MDIICLFSVVNDYDQPGNNLVAAWSTKPSLEAIGEALDIPFPSESDRITIDIVNIWKGETVRVCNTDYRLESFPLLD